MLRLRELQLSFVEAVLAGNDVAIASQLKVRGGTPESRLKVYRNNTFSNLRAALADVYPVILRLVGEDFFKHAATHFIRAHPSTSGDLNDYGGGFGEFLAAFPPAAELPYLCDVARLEWARRRPTTPPTMRRSTWLGSRPCRASAMATCTSACIPRLRCWHRPIRC